MTGTRHDPGAPTDAPRRRAPARLDGTAEGAAEGAAGHAGGGSAAGRGTWAVLDQAVSSATNLGLAVVVARTVSPDGFGAFSLAFTAYVLGLGLVRAVASEPLAVRASVAAPTARRAAAASATGVALATGLALGTVAAAVGLATDGVVREALVALAVCLPGLLLQDTTRFVAFVAGEPRRALANDLMWGALSTTAFVLLIVSGNATVGTFTLAYGTTALVAASIDLARRRITPRVASTPQWLRAHRDLVPAFTGEFLLRNASRHVVVLVLTAVAGLSATAAVRAAQLVFGPLNVALLGVGAIAVPELARQRAAHGDERFARSVTWLSGALVLVAVAVGVGALAVPDHVGVGVLGPSWFAARAVLLPQAALMASMGAVSGYAAGLRVLSAATAGLAVRVMTLPLTLAAGIIGVAVSGSAGAVTGMAAANWCAVLAWRHQWRRAAAAARG